MSIANLRVNTGPATDNVMPDTVRLLNVAAEVADLRGGSGHTKLAANGLIAGRLTMAGGTGNDSIELRRAAVFGDVRLDLGSESNSPYVGYHDVTIGNARITGKLDIRGAGGIQAVTFASDLGMDLEVDGNTRVSLGGGNDRIRFANTGRTVFHDTFTTAMGDGDDAVTVEGKTIFEQDAFFLLQGGNDIVGFQYDPFEDGPFRPRALENMTVHGAGGTDIVNNLDGLQIDGDFIAISIENQG